MLAGEPYFAPDPELAGMQLHARTLLHAFNSSPPPAGGQRREIVRGIFGAVGPDFDIWPRPVADGGELSGREATRTSESRSEYSRGRGQPRAPRATSYR